MRQINASESESDEFNMTSQANVDLFPTFSISEQLSDSSETMQGNKVSDNLTTGQVDFISRLPTEFC